MLYLLELQLSEFVRVSVVVLISLNDLQLDRSTHGRLIESRKGSPSCIWSPDLLVRVSSNRKEALIQSPGSAHGLRLAPVARRR